VLQRTLLASKEEGQRKNLFKTRCSINNNVCEVIVDNGSTENLVSKKLVDYFKLPTKPHEKPYSLGWVSKGSQVLVTLFCKVPISIGKHYREEVLCDFLNMETKTSFLVMTHNEEELDHAVKETECFCPVVIKGLMSVVKEEFPVLGEILEILKDFNELIADKLPNDLPPMRDIQH